jgi:hypothetical protein
MPNLGLTEMIVIAVIVGFIALVLVGAAMFVLNAQNRRNRRDE